MKFRELPEKWKAIIITLSITTLLSFIALIVFITNTVGSLIHVMIE